MRQAVFVMFLCLLPLRTSAQQPDWAKVHSTTIRGIDQLYNLEFEQATATFNSVIQMAPQDPRGYFFKSTVDYWIYLFSKDQAAYDRFMGVSDTVIEICEKALNGNSTNWVAKFYLGGTYGFRGLMHQRNGGMLKAVWDGKKGYSLLEECTRKNPELVDAQMGFGLFTYLVGKIPKSFRWVVNIIGFSGDIEGGLKYMKNAAEHGTYTKSEAAFYLSQFLLAEDRKEEGFDYLHRLLRKYPDNTLFLLTYGSWQSRDNNIDSALSAANRAVEINKRKKLKYGDEIAFNVLSQCYWLKNDFAKAKENYDLYVQTTENKETISNNTWYRLGVCSEMIGKRQEAVEYYKKMKPADDKNRPNEIYLSKKQSDRLAAPLSAPAQNLIKAGNERNMKNVERALSLYNSVRTASGNDVELLVQALYGLQQTYVDSERYKEALDIHKQIVTLKPKREFWIIPHSYFLVGQAYAKQGKKAEAKGAFDKVDDFDDYDFQQSLEDRIESELKKLDSNGKQ